MWGRSYRVDGPRCGGVGQNGVGHAGGGVVHGRAGWCECGEGGVGVLCRGGVDIRGTFSVGMW